MSDIDDYVINNDCHDCVGRFNDYLCNQLDNNCVYKIWVVKEDKVNSLSTLHPPIKPEVTLSDYINSIQEKYPKEAEQPKYPHYFKDVSNVNKIDIYKVLDLWQVTHPCLQHAAKKILVAGNRGHKDVAKDIQEAIDSLERYKEMIKENNKESL